MQLLVSVRSAAEAAAALAGGADIVDAKDPMAGALGPVSIDVLASIVATVNGATPVTAALGDAHDEPRLVDDAAAAVGAGAALIKIGFAGLTNRKRIDALLASAARGASAAHVIAVAYADHDRAEAPSPADVLDAAAHAGIAGVLLDTADKHAPGLTDLVAPQALASWIDAARRVGLLTAVAGKLTAADLTRVRDAGADVAGVRGAACDGSRTGRISVHRVKQLRDTLGRHVPLAAP